MNVPSAIANAARPHRNFSLLNLAAIVVGIVIGVGIFSLPPLVAAEATSVSQYYGFWLLGGAISLLGALCYAELATDRPDAGGEYHFLRAAYGPTPALLFAWARMAVIQTGSIALAAFIVGDHLQLVLPLGGHGPGIWAAVVVMVLTALNLWGTAAARTAQTALASSVALGLVGIALVALLIPEVAPHAASPPATRGAPGLAMILVLLTFGGWNEAAYVSAEARQPRRDIPRGLIAGIALITALYLLINVAYIEVLGLDGLRSVTSAGVALTEQVLGPWGGTVMALLVVGGALSTVNASILTGVRSSYALGRDVKLLGWLGRWNGSRNTPIHAHLAQGVIALGLVVFGTITRDGISAMVDYTAPVFWGFLALTTGTLFVFRYRGEATAGGFSVPLYPLPPLLFGAACLYMLQASVRHTGTGAWLGLLVVALGLPIVLLDRYRRKRTPASEQRAA